MSFSVIAKEDLPGFVDALAQSRAVYAPVAKGPRHSFERVSGFSEIAPDYQPTVLPPKKLFYPQQEDLLRFERSPVPKVESVLPEVELVAFGVRPCDVKAISLLDRFFSMNQSDPHYAARRERAAIIGWDCLEPCWDHCFCASVDALEARGGFDLMLIELPDYYLVEVATETGSELIKLASTSRQAGAHEMVELREARRARKERFPSKLDIDVSELPLLLRAAWDSPVWAEFAEQCLSCGTCNLVCPTCFCFDVYDDVELDLNHGTRVRQWDGCQLRDYAAVAMNENFREATAARMRHRFNCKFNYEMTKFAASFCVGCGRCDQACTASIFIPDVVNHLVAEEAKKEEVTA
jgi:sulfhydrogenase subunit beta (sulfur reductase)